MMIPSPFNPPNNQPPPEIMALIPQLTPILQQILQGLKNYNLEVFEIDVNGAVFALTKNPAILSPSILSFLKPPVRIPVKLEAPQDLVENITKLLQANLPRDDNFIFNPHRTVANEIANMLEDARKRDKESLARELENLIKKFKN